MGQSPPAGCGLFAARLHPKDARSLGIGRATKWRRPMYKPYRKGDPVGDPDRGHFCIARWSRHEVPKTPGLLRYALYMRPR